MADYDLLIRGAVNRPFVGVVDGKIAGFVEGSAEEVIDAGELHLQVGVIDAHVHFNEPGRADWEGIDTGSQACAAGGTTTFIDMPLNAHPPTIDAESFDLKLAAARAKAHVDFALWGGLVPGNVEHLEALRDRGVIGLKAFMSNSGIEDFPMADLGTLRAGMKRAAELGLLVAVHAELERPATGPRGTSVREYLASRPIDIELDAIRAALEMAGEVGCALHVVHVSSAAGVALITEVRAKGQDVTCETCPHYLVLTEEEMERLGAVAKCAPPLRSEAERQALLAQVRVGRVTTISSDHSPSPMSMKVDPDFFKVWGGISGCQHLLTLLFDLELDPESIAALTAGSVAARFGLPDKGRLEIGADADLVLVDLNAQTSVEADLLFYRHHHSPYVGRTLKSRVVRTLARGRTVFLDGRIAGTPQGRFLSRLP